MEFFEALERRRSVRAYERKPIEEEKLRQLLEAVNSAPSAGNLQAYEVVLVRAPERIRQLARASHDQTFIEDAPVVLVFVANPLRNSHTYGRRGEHLYCMQDATIACTYAHLAATALGLSSCWIGAFDDEVVANIIGAEPPLQPAAILPIAYPAEHPTPRPRRPLTDLIHEERLRK
jgi:nitroreductase